MSQAARAVVEEAQGQRRQFYLAGVGTNNIYCATTPIAENYI
jgi:hypothetical protein